MQSDRSVVDGEVALLDEGRGEGVGDGAFDAHGAGDLAVLGQGEGLVGGEATVVAGDLDAGAVATTSSSVIRTSMRRPMKRGLTE